MLCSTDTQEETLAETVDCSNTSRNPCKDIRAYHHESKMVVLIKWGNKGVASFVKPAFDDLPRKKKKKDPPL